MNSELNNLRKLIGEGCTEKALKRLLNLERIKTNNQLENDLSILLGRYNRVKRKHVLSLLNSNEYEREIDKINYGLLTYIIPLIENQNDHTPITNIASFEIPEGMEVVIIKGEDRDETLHFDTELVENGKIGIWKTPLSKGLHNLDISNCKLIKMPTNMIILEWSKHKKSLSRYDSSLTTLNIISKDFYNINMSLIITFRSVNSPKFIKSTGLISFGVSDEINIKSRFIVLNRFTNMLLAPMITSMFRNVFSEIYCHQLIAQKQKYIEIIKKNIKESFIEYGLELIELSSSFIKVHKQNLKDNN